MNGYNFHENVGYLKYEVITMRVLSPHDKGKIVLSLLR
jgi:hypothetical protein